MRVLIFSMTCGEGHNSIAKSLKQEIDERNAGGGTCKIVQAFGFDEARIEKENQRYLRTCKAIPHIYDFIWNRLRKRNPNKPSKVFDNEIKDCEEYFIKQIDEFQPDVIICTHYYASGVIQKLKQKGKLNKNIITSTILTDYSVHPYWEFSHCVDYIFTPREENNLELESRLFRKEQIVCVGMPVKKEATTKLDKDKIRKNFAIDKFTALICGGGNGLGKTLKTVKNVIKYNPDINLIVVNGRNSKTFNDIENYKKKYKIENLINLGFVTNIVEYICASDVVFSRGGALSLTEALCQHKPIIIREKMIINEKLNKEIFIEKGCALGMKKISDAGKLVRHLKDNTELQKQMKDNCKNFAKPNATKDIVDFLYKEFQQKNTRN